MVWKITPLPFNGGPFQKVCCFSILPHLSLKNPHISRPFRRNLWLRRKPAKRNGKEENHYEKQQRTERSPGSGSYGQVQDAGCSGRWWSSYLLNYNRIIQNNSNQRLVSKSIVVHSIKNFISSLFSCYIHKQEIQFSSHARRSAFYEHGFFTCHIANFYPFVRIKKGCIFVQCSKLFHISKIFWKGY